VEERTRDTFKLHLPGLLKVLAEHLYSSKSVAVRELLQNAHDSCVRRGVEEGVPRFRPSIDLFLDPRRRTLTICDNGAGLSRDDVTTYLATIGRSYTRELRERMALLSPDEAARLIGQFGFGFLSAFSIADEVTVTTRSQRAGVPAVRWHCTGEESYEIGPGVRDEPGTTIELWLKPSAAFLLQRQLLIEAVQRYADFLPLPVYLDADPVPLNLMIPPWQADDVPAATHAVIDRRFGGDAPLCLIPLHDQRVELGHDALTIPLQGFLFIPSSSNISIREYGDLTVFIRRMFITDDVRDLLPPWARFVRGVIDCPVLQPTASREEIHRDETFASVQQALEVQLGAGLRDLAQYRPETWRKIVEAHANVIIHWAATDHEFFAYVADIVTFRTTRGRLTLPDYLALTGTTLYFVTRELGSMQDRLLAEAQDVPVIEAAWIGVEPFLHSYAHRHPGISLVQMDGEAAHLMRPTPVGQFRALVDVYRGRGIRVRVSAFRPESVPALMLYPRDADVLVEGRDALKQGDLPAPFAAMVSGYLDHLESRKDDDEGGVDGTLHLNASCPLMRRLADAPKSQQTHAALWLIYSVARLFAGRAMTPADASATFQDLGTSLEALLP